MKNEFVGSAWIRGANKNIDHLEEKTGICDCLFAVTSGLLAIEQTVPEFNSQFKKQ